MRPLVIEIVTPAGRGSHGGNRVTALRWARLLRRLGQRVRIAQTFSGQACDALIALHAVKSLPSARAFRLAYPRAPLIVALTGTDLYLELGEDRAALGLATRIVVLQERALGRLLDEERGRARVIVQSASPPAVVERGASGFVCCVLAHLREVKDPLAAATAARRMPPSSRLAIVHAGRALDAELGRAAAREMRENPRYRWLGDLPRARALSILAGSDLLVVSSRAEGGANVVGEAIACGRPVVSSRIDGSIGLLGEDHPGYFAPGDTDELAALLERVEHDATFREELTARSRQLLPRVDPALELESWRTLLGELSRKEVA